MPPYFELDEAGHTFLNIEVIECSSQKLFTSQLLSVILPYSPKLPDFDKVSKTTHPRQHHARQPHGSVTTPFGLDSSMHPDISEPNIALPKNRSHRNVEADHHILLLYFLSPLKTGNNAKAILEYGLCKHWLMKDNAHTTISRRIEELWSDKPNGKEEHLGKTTSHHLGEWKQGIRLYSSMWVSRVYGSTCI